MDPVLSTFAIARLQGLPATFDRTLNRIAAVRSPAVCFCTWWSNKEGPRLVLWFIRESKPGRSRAGRHKRSGDAHDQTRFCGFAPRRLHDNEASRLESDDERLVSTSVILSNERRELPPAHWCARLVRHRSDRQARTSRIRFIANYNRRSLAA